MLEPEQRLKHEPRFRALRDDDATVDLARVRARVIRGVAAAGLVGSALGSASAHASGAALGGVASVVKAAAVVVGVSAVAVGVAVVREPAPPPVVAVVAAVAVAAPATASPVPVLEAPVVDSDAIVAAPPAPELPVVAKPPPRPRAASTAVPRQQPIAPPVAPAPSTLSAETALLDRALVSLSAGRVEAALNLLDEHRALYPRSLLAPEVELSRLDALARLGRRGDVEALAERLLAEPALADRHAEVRALVERGVTP